MKNNYEIRQNDFFRLSFILQDRSETTINACLYKIIEDVIYSVRKEMSLDDLREEIRSKFGLEFTNDDINNALNRYLNKKNNIVRVGNKYSLSPSYIEEYEKKETAESELKKYVSIFKKEYNIDENEDKLYDLISRYVYYCFNSSKEDILALINYKDKRIKDNFNVSDSEKQIINKFLSWDNESKNTLIYMVVSYCYVYCTLTAKRNSMLTKEIFSNKTFYLDANIVFRLAGLNKEDRQKTISTFKKKCEELNVKLYYTSETYDEIYRVVDGGIKWLQTVNGNSAPPNLNDISFKQKDIYEIYYSWCMNAINKPGDYSTFKKYLMHLINESLDGIKVVDINKYVNDNVVQLSNDIKKYKYQKNKDTSTESAVTDAKNINFIFSKRNNLTDKNIYSTQHFLITADQILISFLNEEKSGVPIAVLPSTWLSIMLKFGGRTDDDLKSFILFMNLRYGIGEDSDINITSLLHELTVRTDNNEIKRLIVEDVYYNRDCYKELIENNDYSNITEKAFDEIIKEKELQKSQEFLKEKEEIKKRSDKEKLEAEELAKKLANEDNARRLAEKDFRLIKIVRMFLSVVAALIFCCFLVFIFVSFSKILKLTSIPLPQFIHNDYYVAIAIFVGTVSLAILKSIMDYMKYIGTNEFKEKIINTKIKIYLSIFNK